MNGLDWIVMILILAGIIIYGVIRSRKNRDLESYFLSGRSMPWWLVLLSIMGTQASAITFISGPGQAFADGMRFLQYYFGLPLAMIVICVSFVPIYNKLKVFTAYEYLEQRFDRKTRLLTSGLFLLQRGLSTGLSIYAPSIILATLFHWPIVWTNIIMGGLLIIYTVSGGSKAVSYTQQLQVVIILIAMAVAGYYIVSLFPAGHGLKDMLHLSGSMGKTNVITTGNTGKGFDWNDRYNIWSGLIGGFFLALSYFGTDQSQVGRYLTAQNNRQSRLGLLLNGFVKIPMQFGILLIGVLIFAFYQVQPRPVNFNEGFLSDAQLAPELRTLQTNYDSLSKAKSLTAERWLAATAEERPSLEAAMKEQETKAAGIKKEFDRQGRTHSVHDPNDTNYVFLSFVKNHLPAGLRGLLIAVIFLAAWGSIAAALNALAASTVIDFHPRLAQRDPAAQVTLSRWYSLGWGLFSIVIAMFANRIGQSLIEAVNILGSLFYGVILGVFLVALYLRSIGGSIVFYSALIIQLLLFALFFNEQVSWLRFLPDLGFLWLNALGALAVVLLSWILHRLSLNNK